MVEKNGIPVEREGMGCLTISNYQLAAAHLRPSKERVSSYVVQPCDRTFCQFGLIVERFGHNNLSGHDCRSRYGYQLTCVNLIT